MFQMQENQNHQNIKTFWSQIIKIPQLKVERANYKGQTYNVVQWRKGSFISSKSW